MAKSTPQKSASQVSNLMPEIREVTVGIKEPRTVKLYPLSLADQLEMADVAVDILSNLLDLEQNPLLQRLGFGSQDNEEEEESESDERSRSVTEIINLVVNLAKDNIPQLIEKVFDDVKMNEVTNDQFMEIAYNVYEMNFQDLGKKWKGLLDRAQTKSPSQSRRS